MRELWGFVRESTPGQKRSRYGDMEYDWEQRVNTTAGTVGWRTRLLGVFHSPYQPTEPELFREMMAALPINFCDFTFVDIGSGKGRALLLAAEYPFRRIIGVEVLAELHQAAEENVAAYRERTGQESGDGDCEKGAERTTAIVTLCMDAREFVFPETPLVVYLFNPLPETGLRRVIRNLEESCRRAPREVWVLYHNPELKAALEERPWLNRANATPQYAVYRTRAGANVNEELLRQADTDRAGFKERRSN